MTMRLVLLILLLLTTASAKAAEVVVFAAASMTEAMEEAGRAFTAATGHTVVISAAGSQTLARQIEQGAPAAVFVSADKPWMDYLAQRGLVVSGSRFDLAGNQLVQVIPPRVPPGVTKIAVGDPDSVPVGRYYRQAMEKLGQWKEVEPHLARTTSVREAMALVERGEVKMGIAYGTDVQFLSKTMTIVPIPAGSHDSIVYPVALISGGDSPAARALMEFLKGQQVRALLTRMGFSICPC